MGKTRSWAASRFAGPLALSLSWALSIAPAGAQGVGPQLEDKKIPAELDPMNLSLEDVRKFSTAQDFEILGHSYFKVDGRTPWAKGQGRGGGEVGSGFNTVRVHDGIAYLAGYNSPPTLFGVLIADVRDPKDMKPLSFIPCNPGARCPYLRVNREKKVLIFGHDADPRANPNKVPEGQRPKTGWSFYDISDPRNPKELAFVPAPAAGGGKTHGMEADDRYVYGCGTFSPDLNREGLQIIDYSDPKNIRQVATWHVPGQLKGETPDPMNRNGPDGKPQIIQCHEIVHYNDRLYLAWRDAGMIVLDVKDRTQPKVVATYDYVPPFHGGFLGAAHTSLPVVTKRGEHPDLVVHTDEIFDCPQGFGRILDVSDLKNPDVIKGERPANVQLLSTYRIPYVHDNFDQAKGEFACPKASAASIGTVQPQTDPTVRSNTTHLPWIDQRSPSLLYQTWYDEGLRAIDISNPFAPRFIGYYRAPAFGGGPGVYGRFTREVFQDPDTNLLYLTDGSGGGLTVLRYTGPIPDKAPLPGAR